MRHKSTELMGTIKAFVEEHYKNYRHSPSTTEIADAVGIARGTAYKYLVAMNENGMIRYDGQQISTEKTEKVQTEFTSVALLGAVSCGVPTLEEEDAEEDEAQAGGASEDTDESYEDTSDASADTSDTAADTSDSGSSSQGTYLGNFTLTAYCNCAQCCGTAGNLTASGTVPTAGRTVAMAGVPFGTKLLINGNVYTVEDIGTPYGHVDIYCGSHEEALSFGLQSAEVYQLN